MTARGKSQLNLPPVEVRKSEQPSAPFRNPEHQPGPERLGAAVLGNSEQRLAALRIQEHADDRHVLAASILDEAFRLANLESKEAAHLVGVSTSLVDKWRSVDERGCPSLAQLLMLPPTFHIALHRVMNRRFGFGRAALSRLLEAAGDLALGVEP